MAEFALCFDVYGTLVDPIRIHRQLADHVGGDAQRVSELWRHKQLEYTFRLTVMGRYEDFEWVTRRALWYAFKTTGHELDPAAADALMARYDELDAFPDVDSGLERLARSGHRMVAFSNGTPRMLAAVLRSAGLEGRLEGFISVDEVRTYKPAAAVYHHCAQRLGVPVAKALMVSANPFDVIGARGAGLEAVWIARSAAVFDPLGVEPSMTVGSLVELAERLA